MPVVRRALWPLVNPATSSFRIPEKANGALDVTPAPVLGIGAGGGAEDSVGKADGRGAEVICGTGVETGAGLVIDLMISAMLLGG